MNTKNCDENNLSGQQNKFQNLLNSLSECKIEFIKDKEECKKLKEKNAKLEQELKEAYEIEKSHRCQLLSSREMIGNLQETVSQLVYLKRDMKKLKDESLVKDTVIASFDKEREGWIQKHNEKLKEIKTANEKELEEIRANNERKIQQALHDADTQVAQYTCVIEELRCKMKYMETENRDKLNAVIAEYEEKLQRSNAKIALLQDQHAGVLSRTNANIDAYRRRLEEVEEKFKQSNFKQYLEQSSSHSQYDNVRVERPYSQNKDCLDVDLDPVLENPKKSQMSCQSTSKLNRTSNFQPLQVNYYGNKPPGSTQIDKKGPFNIVKKRKLYNDKQFNDF